MTNLTKSLLVKDLKELEEEVHLIFLSGEEEARKEELNEIRESAQEINELIQKSN